MEIEIVTFVVKGSMKLTVPTDWQEQIQVGSRSVAFRRVFDLKLKRRRCIYMWSWTEMPTASYRPRARTVWIPLRTSIVFENKQLAPQFNFKSRNIDDVLSTNNPGLENYFGQMYPAELDKETMENNTSTSHLDLQKMYSFDRDGRSAVQFLLRQTWRFKLPYHKLSVPE